MMGKILLLVGLMAFTFGVHGGELILADAGKSDYQIVIPETFADPGVGDWIGKAAELVQFAFKKNGVDVPIATESHKDDSKPCLYLGDTTFARSNGIDPDSFKGWSYAWKTVGDDVIIVGNDVAGLTTPGKSCYHRGPESEVGSRYYRLGTVKGVVDFLRTYVGTRFLYPADAPDSTGVEYLPTPVVKIPADLDVTHSPAVEFNHRSRDKESFYEIANNFFPPVEMKIRAHTWPAAIPLEKFGDDHPEYFALIDGKRNCVRMERDQGWRRRLHQYCISNPEVRELIYRDVLSWLDMGYEAASLGQPDGFRPCQCERCRSLYGTEDDWDEKIWVFHRDLAKRANTDRHGKKVELIAYQNTEEPPKTFRTFPDNVTIRLCGYSDKHFKQWKDTGFSGDFSTHIYNWGSYQLGGGYTPKRTPAYVARQVQRFRRNHVKGISLDGFGELFGLEGPVYYVFGRGFDAPDAPQAGKLLDEFCEAAFGDASEPMKKFYDTLYHGIALYSDYLAIQGIKPPVMTYIDVHGKERRYVNDSMRLISMIYSPDLLLKLEEELSEAEKSAKSVKVKRRLKLVRMEFDYLKKLATVAHLHNAYKIQPDQVSLERLLAAVEDWQAFINQYERNRLRPIDGWKEMYPFNCMGTSYVGLRKNNMLSRFKDSPLNWDMKSVRASLKPLLIPRLNE